MLCLCRAACTTPGRSRSDQNLKRCSQQRCSCYISVEQQTLRSGGFHLIELEKQLGLQKVAVLKLLSPLCSSHCAQEVLGQIETGRRPMIREPRDAAVISLECSDHYAQEASLESRSTFFKHPEKDSWTFTHVMFPSSLVALARRTMS